MRPFDDLYALNMKALPCMDDAESHNPKREIVSHNLRSCPVLSETLRCASPENGQTLARPVKTSPAKTKTLHLNPNPTASGSKADGLRPKPRTLDSVLGLKAFPRKLGWVSFKMSFRP